MISHRRSLVARLIHTSAIAGLAAAAAAATAQSVPILQPGAPGQAPAVLTPEQAVQIAGPVRNLWGKPRVAVPRGIEPLFSG